MRAFPVDASLTQSENMIELSFDFLKQSGNLSINLVDGSRHSSLVLRLKIINF